MQRPAIWPTHRLLPLCVLYLNKLVTGLKNVYDKWCEEKLDHCLSAPICPVHFLSTAIPWRFYLEEKAKENKSCFYLSFSRRMAWAQNAVWTKPGKPSCTKHNRKSISIQTKHIQPHRLCWIWCNRGWHLWWWAHFNIIKGLNLVFYYIEMIIIPLFGN